MLRFVAKFDFGDDKAEVVAQEFIDFPDKAIVKDFSACFFDLRFFAEFIE